jgi:hypothetical protein
MQWLKKPTITDTIRLNRLRWFGQVERMEENRIPKKVLRTNFEATRLRVRHEIDGKMKCGRMED